jgi:hypothetical protein
MRSVVQFAARLVIGLGVVLNGLNPAMAGSAAPNGCMAAHMTVMPPMDMGSRNGAPVKQMPCGGMDCGCCIGGACAMPVLVQTVRDICPSWSSCSTSHHSVFFAAITFPPDIRPPISPAVTA